LRWIGPAAVAAGCLFAAAPAGAAPDGRWYIESGAAPGGDGSRQHPFDSLAQAESASGATDTLVVLAPRPGAPALDGGIALKPGQTLTGDAGPVTAPDAGVPAITNTDPDRHDGDGVVLAEGARVADLHITGTARSAISGADVGRATITGNLLTVFNQTHAIGNLGPGLTEASGAVLRVSFVSGAAGIELTNTGAEPSRVRIAGNTIADAASGGLLLRATDTAAVHLDVTDTVFRDLQAFAQDLPPYAVVHNAMQIDADRSATVDARLSDIDVTNVGSPTTNNDGLLVFQDGDAKVAVDIRGYHYSNPNRLGNVSATAMELYGAPPNPRGPGSQPGSSIDVRVRDSDITAPNGSGLQAALLGHGLRLGFEVRHTAIRHAGIAPWVPSDAPKSPNNNGSCIALEMIGVDNAADYDISGNSLDACMGSGVMLSNYNGFGWGDNRSITADIRHNTITNQSYAGVDFYNSGTLADTAIEGAHNTIAGSGHFGLAFDDYSGGAAGAKIDFGGGALHTAGHNSIAGSGEGAAAVRNLAVTAERNWWGSAAGPQGVSLIGTATFDGTPFLGRAPSG
jgi:hypothetical protein